MTIKALLFTGLCATAIACAQTPPPTSSAPTPADAKAFLDKANATTLKLGSEQQQAGWVQQTFITDDTEAISARASQALNDAVARVREGVHEVRHGATVADERRQLNLLKLSIVLATPSDPKEADELSKIMARLEATYGKGKWCKDPAKPDTCSNIDEITEHHGGARRRKGAARRRGRAGTPSRRRCARTTSASSSCRTKARRNWASPTPARCGGSKYDMPPDEFTKELDRLWDQVRPLYLSLHAYVADEAAREVRRCRAGDGSDSRVPPGQHVGAGLVEHLSDSSRLPNADPGYSLTEILKKRNMPALDMVRAGERFYTSLGFAPLPKTFFERSLFVRPSDRDVVCHASAWDIDYAEDLRIKMCIEPTAEDFNTIHHELGHNFYQRAYNDQPMMFRDSANDGFHEAIGDTIALSVTPEYLVKIGLLDKAPDSSRDIGLLMYKALEKIAFLPVRSADRSVALESVRRRDYARRSTTRRGGICS